MSFGTVYSCFRVATRGASWSDKQAPGLRRVCYYSDICEARVPLDVLRCVFMDRAQYGDVQCNQPVTPQEANLALRVRQALLARTTSPQTI
jgi:hypothetical protein